MAMSVIYSLTFTLLMRLTPTTQAIAQITPQNKNSDRLYAMIETS
jgi:hypothetical protein